MKKIISALALVCLMILGVVSGSYAATQTTVGAVSAWPESATSIKVKMPYSGDDTSPNNTYTVKWKTCAEGTYPGANVINGAHTASPYITTINGLTGGTCYNIEASYGDADGVTGVNPQTLRITAGGADTTLLHNSNRFIGTTKWGGSWGLSGAKYGEITCATCHETNTTNIKRIKSTITSPNTPTDDFPGGAVNFQSTGATNGFGDDSDSHATSSRICEVCHSITNHHRFNTTGQTDGKGHQNNTDCLACHPHAVGFFYATSDCGSCHGNPPSVGVVGATGVASPATGATNPANPGAHVLHATTKGMLCDACHTGTTMPTVSNSIQMGFTVNTTNVPGWSATPATGGTFNGSDALNAPYTWAGAAGTTINPVPNTNNVCSNLYCHGGGNAVAGKAALTGGSNISPSWVGGASQAACGTCHGGSGFAVSSASAPTTGSHDRHAKNTAGNVGLACNKCHGTTPADMTHVNAEIKWGLDTADSRIGASGTYNGASSGTIAGLAPSASYGNCSNLYCHSIAQTATGGALTGAVGEYASPTWGNAVSGQCGTCHEGDGVQGNATTIASGSHLRHTSDYALPCASCHDQAGAGTVKHADHSIDIAITGGGTYSGDAIPGNGYGDCASVYCHSTGTAIPAYSMPSWGNATTGSCGTCHGATKDVPPATGSHEKHVKNDALLGDVYQFNCYKCHKNTVDNVDPATISTTGLSTYHVKNSTRDVALDTADALIGASATHDSGTNSCSNIYCHSTGKDGIVPNTELPIEYAGSHYANPTWGSTVTCASCHGRTQTGGTYVGYPDYTMADQNADQGTERANSHLSTTHNNTSCSVCHYSTTTDGETIASNTHVNAAINVVFDPAYDLGSATYNQDKTCSNVACHGVHSATWGAAGGCTDCHDAGAVNISGVHSRHWETAAGNAAARVLGNSSTSTYYQFQCLTCHYGGTHPTGNVGQNYAELGFNINWAPAAYQTNGQYIANYNANDTIDSRLQKVSTDGNCSSVYCHSSGIAPGSPGPIYANISWNTTPAVPNDCAVCHGAPPATNRHLIHASTYGMGCIECHQATVSDNTTIADKSKHVNAINDVAWKTGGKNVDGSPYGSPNCANIYCHSQGRNNAAPYDVPNTAAVWTNATTTECTGCHRGDATASGNLTMATGKHAQHINNAGLIGVNITCDKCHSATAGGNRAVSNTANHTNKLIDVAFTSPLNAGATYSANQHIPGGLAGSCDNLYCHSAGNLDSPSPYRNPSWTAASWGGQVCNKCHGTSTTAGQPDYASGTAGSATANSHERHVGIQQMNCSTCHLAVTTNGTAINGSNPSLHINRNTQNVDFTPITVPPVTGTTITGNYNGGAKSCSTVYCHSNVQAPGGNGAPTTFGSPVWGGNGSLDCGSCHPNMATTTDLTLGTHQRHTNSPENGVTYQCSMCHGAGYTPTAVTATGTHANRNIDLNFTGQATGTTYSQAGNNPPGNGYGTCSTSACHGRATKNWGTSTTLVVCEKCHGSANSIAVDNGFRDTSGNTGSAYAGTHKSHLTGLHNYTDPIHCDNCHTEPAAVTDAGHMSGLPATLTWGPLATGSINTGTPTMSPAYSGEAGGRTCSNTYCHTQGGNPTKQTPYWGDLGYGLSCGNCHSNPPAYPHTASTNCTGCHYHVAASNTAFKDSYLLIEGLCSKRTYRDQTTCESNFGTWTPSGQTVTGKSLHIDGVVQFTNDECLDCHSTSGVMALIGQHPMHTDNDLFLSRSDFTGNASGGSTLTVVDATQTWTADSLIGKYIRITNGANKNKQIKIQSNTSNTITTVSAFSSAITVGTTYDVRTAKRLSNDDYDDPGWIYTIEYDNGFPKYACGFCHPSDSSNHRNGTVNLDMDPTHSLPGTVKTKNAASAPWFQQTVSGSNVTCVAVYCHSNGFQSPGTNTYQYKTTPNWYAVNPWASVDRCSQCHGNSPNTGGTQGSPAHGKHIVGIHVNDTFSGTVGKMTNAHGDGNSTVINCNVCHTQTVAVSYNDNSTLCSACHSGGSAKGSMIVDPNNTIHVNGSVDVTFVTPLNLKTKAQLRSPITAVTTVDNSWSRSNGYKQASPVSFDLSKTTPTYSAGTCNTTACHNGTPMQWNQAGPLQCVVCHLGTPK